tara:strand:- start:151 stop:426 length:276 start_codon:yes stop_codon:yes gene_type:complete
MFKNIFKFGEIMAKKAKKTKKAVKNVEVLAPPVTPKASTSSIDVRKHIKEISGTRKDASTVLEVITDEHTDDDIRVIVKSLQFDTLLGEIS